MIAVDSLTEAIVRMTESHSRMTTGATSCAVVVQVTRLVQSDQPDHSFMRFSGVIGNAGSLDVASI